MSIKLISAPSSKQAKRIVYVGAIGAVVTIVPLIIEITQIEVFFPAIQLLSIIAAAAFLFTTVSMMIYNRILLIAGIFAVALCVVGNTTTIINVVQIVSVLLQATALVMAALFIWSYIQNYKVLKTDIQQKVKYTVLTILATIGSIVSLGAVILIAVVLLSIRACQLSGSSKCL